MSILKTDENVNNGNGHGWKKHLSLDRALLIIVVLFNTGQLWQQQQNTNDLTSAEVTSLNSRLQDAEQRIDTDRIADATTYVRQDVLEVRLRAIEKEMGEIKFLIQQGRIERK